MTTAAPPLAGRLVVEEYLSRNYRIVIWSGEGYSKGPRAEGWQARAAQGGHTIADYHEGAQVGLLTGVEVSPGKYFADADLDWAPGVDIARAFMPPTHFIVGRKSKPVSHLFYLLDAPVPSLRIKDPVDQTTYIELRCTKRDGSCGLQSMTPPSKWRKEGHEPEPLEFRDFGLPDFYKATEIVRRVILCGIGMMLAHRFGKNGFGHEARMAWAGFLLRAGIDKDDLVLMGEKMSIYCNNLEVEDVREVVNSQAKAIEDGHTHVFGAKKLAEIIGGEDGKRVIALIKKLLGLRGHEGPIKLEDFYAYMPMHQYLFIPSREFWPVASVNARLGSIAVGVNEEGEEIRIKASAYLDRHRPAEQLTWSPGRPLLVQDRLVSDGGWIEAPGFSCLNLYRPPQIALGDPKLAEPWIQLVRHVYPNDAERIIRWCAHRVQRPQEKINHALVLGGMPGIGKDSILEPVKTAVGSWNFKEVSPKNITGRFNGFLKSVILRISEARDLGDISRYDFYEHMKVYTAAPPDVLTVDEKHIKEHSIFNVCGIIITTNYATDCLYLPANDRRHDVMWSTVTPADFKDGYWKALYDWYDNHGGRSHVAAYLASYDLSQFDPKAPPPKTEAFWAIVDANRPPEDAALADVIDKIAEAMSTLSSGKQLPKALTLQMLGEFGDAAFVEWLEDRKNSRAIPRRLKDAGYVPHSNKDAKDGLWKIDGKRQRIYVLETLSVREREEFVNELTGKASVVTDVSGSESGSVPM